MKHGEPRTEAEWRAYYVELHAELDAYDDLFHAEEKREFFESYETAVQDCINRRNPTRRVG